MDDRANRPGPRPSRGSAPVAFLAMLALIAAIESGLMASIRLDVTNPATLTWRLARDAVSRDAPGCRALYFGDSLVKHGLLPPVIDPWIGGRSYNLAVCAAAPLTSYVLLRDALEAGARPDSIVVDFAPDLLVGEPGYNLRNWPELLSWRDLTTLALDGESPGLAIQVGLGKLVPSYRARLEIRDLLSGTLGGIPTLHRSTNVLYTKHWSDNRGGQLTPPNPAFTGAVSEEELQTLLADKFWCHKVNRRAIEGILRLAESRSIRVYWLLPPVSPALQARRDSSGSEARHEAFVRSFQAKHPGLVVLDARRAGYDWPVFQDARHLVDAGTLALSEAVGVAVSDQATGWVMLPSFRAPARIEGLADVNQTRMALELESRPPRR